MATDNFVQPAIPRFDGHYDHWSMLMENFIRSKEYWRVVSQGIEEPADGTNISPAQKTELESLRLRDLKAKNYLFQAIDRSILETILSKETSKGIWDSMKRKYQGTTRAKRQQLQLLRREFELLKMNSGESVSDYFAQVMATVNKMRINGDKTDDITVIEKVLRSLTPKFNYVVCSIEESKDIDDLIIDELQSSLLVHEQKFKQEEKEEQALKVATDSHRGKERGRGGRGYRGGRGNNYGRGRGNNYGRGRGNRIEGKQSQNNNEGERRPFDKSKIECFRCHRFGHYSSSCYTKLPHENEKLEKVNFAQKNEEETLLMAFHNKEDKYESDIWYLDTGCSNHMCGDKLNISNLNEEYDGKFW